MHQAVIAAKRPTDRVSVHLLFALLCATVAGFTLSSAIVLSASPDTLLIAGKSVIATGFLCWMALLWFATVSLKPDRLWIPLALSVLWIGLSLLNLAAATPLLYLNFVAPPHPQPGFPANATGMMHVSQAWLLAHGLILATWIYALWCALRLYRRGLQLLAACWLTGLALLAMTTALDLATVAGWVAAAYVSPLGWVALLTSFAIPLLSISANTLQGQTVQDHAGFDSDSPIDSEIETPALLPALPHLPTTRHGMPAAFRWPSDIGTAPQANAEDISIAPAAFDMPSTAPSDGKDVHTETATQPPTSEEPAPGTTPSDADLVSIIQFTRIALRRIERGKGDPRKFAALFRAILHRAEAARDTLHARDEQTHDPAEYDVNTAVAEAVAQAQSNFTESDIRIVQKLAPGLPHVGVQRHILMQVLHELLADACTATRSSPEHKPVLVMTRPTQDGCVEVSVTDAGDEVSLQEIQGAFESLLEGRHVSHAVRLIETAEFIAAYGGQLRCTPNPAGGSIRHLHLPTR